MNKLLILLTLLLSIYPIRCAWMEKNDPAEDKDIVPEYYRLYHEMELTDIIDIKAFEMAVEGFRKIDPKKNVITLIDYTKPPTEERFFVFDLESKEILYTSHVLHGRNSGYELPTSFSNEVGSNKSSLGFFLTEGTYYGKYGYSLVIDGLEKGINDRAKERAIVIHGSKFASPSVINTAKRIPRSLGCPAVPANITEEIINIIKNGSLVFIYADDEEYVKNSDILNSDQILNSDRMIG